MAAFMRPCVYGFVFIFLFLHRTKHTFSFFLHLEYLDMILILFIVRVRAQRCFHSIFFLLSSYTDHSYYTIEEKEKNDSFSTFYPSHTYMCCLNSHLIIYAFGTKCAYFISVWQKQHNNTNRWK